MSLLVWFFWLLGIGGVFAQGDKPCKDGDCYYITNGLAQHYDAIKNMWTGSEHSWTALIWKDLVGSNTGIVENATWNWDALEFNGINSIVEYSGDITSHYTIMGTVLVNYVAGKKHPRFVDGVNTSYPGLYFYTSWGGLAYALYWHGKDHWNVTKASPNGKRIHIAYSFDGTQVKLYVNGVFTRGITTKTQPLPRPLNWLGGSKSFAESRFLSGEISNFMRYEGALSNEEIAWNALFDNSRFIHPGEITWIVSYDTTPTTWSITVTLTLNKTWMLITNDGWSCSGCDDYSIIWGSGDIKSLQGRIRTKTYSKNITETLLFADVWGNTGKTEFSISNIHPPLEITSLLPSTGLIIGGNTVVIKGSWFLQRLPRSQPTLTSNTSYGLVTSSSVREPWGIGYKAFNSIFSSSSNYTDAEWESAGWVKSGRLKWELPITLRINEISFYNNYSSASNRTKEAQFFVNDAKTQPIGSVFIWNNGTNSGTIIPVDPTVETDTIVLHVSSSYGSQIGASEIIITADYLTWGVTFIKFWDLDATSFTILDNNTIEAVVPPVSYGLQAGLVDVTVGNDWWQKSVLSGGYEYLYPSIEALNVVYDPTSGSITTNTVVVTLTLNMAGIITGRTSIGIDDGFGNFRQWTKTFTTNTWVLVEFENIYGSLWRTGVTIDWISPTLELMGNKVIHLPLRGSYTDEGALRNYGWLTGITMGTGNQAGMVFGPSNTIEFHQVGNYVLDYSYTTGVGLPTTNDRRVVSVSHTPTENSGGGGGISFTKDNCPDGDFSPSYYDGTCSIEESLPGEVGDWSNELIQANDDIITAYERAYGLGITTLFPMEKAIPTWDLLRSDLAKIAVVFSENVLNKQADISKNCSSFSESISTYSETDLYDFMIQSCQMGVMGISSDGVPLPDFNPSWVVSRAEFGTVLSRMLFGTTYNESDPRYAGHLGALQKDGIMTQIDSPLERKEIRQWVRLMLMRSTK